MLIGAHRGAFKDDPALDENSIPAFKRAIEFKVDYIEFDVHKTIDEKFVIYHNNEVVMKDGSVAIKDGSWHDCLEDYRLPITNEPLPLLENVLATCKGKIRMNIEIKDPIIGKDVVELVLAKGLTIDDFFVSSFHESVVKDIALIEKGVSTGFLFLGNPWSINGGKMAVASGCEAINPYYRFLTRRLVSYAKKHALDIHTWTVNGKHLKKYLKHDAITSIITNDVLQSLDLREKLL